MVTARARLGELLLSRGLITQEALDKALTRQKEEPAPLGQILVQLGSIQELELLEVLAEQKGARPWDLAASPPEPEAVSKIPARICIEHRIIPVAINGPVMILAMMDPASLDTIDLVQAITKLKVIPVCALDSHLMKAINGLQIAITASERVQLLVDQALAEKEADEEPEASDLKYDERPVVLLIDEILSEAVALRASDIHFEPQRNRVDLRYRVDGHLRIARQLPKSLTAQVVSRLKVMAQLDLIEFRIPQDGRFEMFCHGRKVDFRLNVLPSLHGPRVVLRILDRATALRYLDSVGMIQDTLVQYRKVIAKPYGLLLVTGPSGSGKSTTLYGTIGELKEFRGNVMTCEDPIEYEVDGISQSQIDSRFGLTFASHIRAVMRQDPDVILVGEIRDKETAEAAIRASLTGHLVLSTLHANSAPDAIPRLIDLGVDSRLLSSALIGITAQRLVRTLCSCAAVHETDESDRGLLEYMGAPLVSHIKKPVGCRKCGLTGYFGRIGIHELLPINGSVATAFEAPDAPRAIAEAGAPFGYVAMQKRAVDLVVEGVTSIEEVMSLVAFDGESRTRAEEDANPNVAWLKALHKAAAA